MSTYNHYIGDHADGSPMYVSPLVERGTMITGSCGQCFGVGFTGSPLLGNLSRCKLCNGSKRIHFVNPDPKDTSHA